jgi:flagellar hook protein FlgE
MLRSLYAGVSGMTSNQTKMDVIGNNIANTNTTAFKYGRVRFQDMLSQTQANAQSPSAQGKGGINPQQVGLGVSVAAIDTVFEGGALQPTGRDLDFAIENEGFFIVSEDSSGIMKRYTRDGAFFKDYQGNLVNAEGLRILGYQPISGKSTQDINDINTANNANLKPLSIPGEIDAGFAEYINYAQMYNDEANEIYVISDFDNISDLDRAIQSAEEIFKLANDVLTMAQVAMQYSRSSVFESAINDEEANLKAAMDEFQTAIDSADIDAIKEALVGNDGDGGAMGAAKKLQVAIEEADNNPKEKVTLEAYSIDGSGLISAVYDDGQVYFLGRLGMAMFENPEGLEKLGGNTYCDSRNSGVPQIGNPNEDGFGIVRQGNLEMSNVDLANEFTEMIITSRAYQANSRTITTSDEMLQELINLKR